MLEAFYAFYLFCINPSRHFKPIRLKEDKVSWVQYR